MMSAVFLLIGILLGAGLTYLLTKEHITVYKEGFSRGFEADKGYTPFAEEKPENQVVSSDFKASEEDEEEREPLTIKTERWDD